MKGKLQLTTRFNQNRPVTLAGLTFFSKRLNGEEEMELQGIQIQSSTSKASETLLAEVEFFRDIVAFRLCRPSDTVDSDFIEKEMGKANAVNLLNYLRNGGTLKPGETFDLPSWGEKREDGTIDDLFTLEDRTFRARALNYAEQLEAAYASEAADLDPMKLVGDATSLMNEAIEISGDTVMGSEEDLMERLERMTAEGLATLERVKHQTRIQADICAEYLNRRLVEGEPITGTWLLQQVTDQDVSAIINFLTTGEVPEAAEDGDDTPNAEAGVSA